MKILGALGALIGALSFVSAAAAETELKNDGFVSGGTAGFQSGFIGTEIGASRFVAPAGSLQLLKVQLLFGGATTTQTVTLKVWDDTAGTDAPGAEIYSQDFSLTGSDTSIQQIVPESTVTVPQQFRVGIVFQHSGLPSIARDVDGNIAADKNYILASGLGWTKSQSLGLAGDWIIRAFVSDSPGAPDAGPGPGPDAGPSGAACSSNAQCAAGEFCDLTNHVCTFECRNDADCGDGTCNSLGQCLTGEGGGGCCRTDRGGPAGGALLGLGLLLVLRRRRR